MWQVSLLKKSVIIYSVDRKLVKYLQLLIGWIALLLVLNFCWPFKSKHYFGQLLTTSFTLSVSVVCVKLIGWNNCKGIQVSLTLMLALHLLDEALSTPQQQLHTASSLLRSVKTPTPLRQLPMSASGLRHSACMYVKLMITSLVVVSISSQMVHRLGKTWAILHHKFIKHYRFLKLK